MCDVYRPLRDAPELARLIEDIREVTEWENQAEKHQVEALDINSKKRAFNQTIMFHSVLLLLYTLFNDCYNA